MTWPMDQCLPVEKIRYLERFPFRFNNPDIETYQLHTKVTKRDGSIEMRATDVFFYKESWGLWCCGKVQWNTFATGYKDMNQAGCTGWGDPYKVEVARTIEEALDNYNAFEKEVWG